MKIELEHSICDNLELEDTFIIDAKRQIESYEESMKKFCIDVNSQRRITVYPEDMPLYKMTANTKHQFRTKILSNEF